jgi:iron complex outermembrane receptor protein
MIPDAVVGPGADHRLWQYRGEKIVGAAFVSHRFRPVDRLAVQADLQLTGRRYRFYDEKTFDRENLRSHAFTVPYLFVNPRLGATLYPDQPLSAYASVAFASREPRRTQLYDGAEGPAGATPQFARRSRQPSGAFDYEAPLIEPEHLVDVELGGSIERARSRLSATLFWMTFWDEIVPSGGVDQFGVPRTGNADRTRHVGLELEGALQLRPDWTLSGNAMLARTRFVDFTEYRTVGGRARALERDGNPIAASPEQLANLRTAYTWRGLRAGLHLQAVGRQYVDNSGGRAASVQDGELVLEPDDALTVDPYALLNASLTYEAPSSTPFAGLRLQLTVHNLLDTHVLRHGFRGVGGPRFYPAAPRHAFAELRYTL